MRHVRRLFMISAVALVLVGAASASAQETVATEMPICLTPMENSVVAAELPREAGWATVRTYFKATDRPNYYFLEMRADAGMRYWAALPLPEQDTQMVDAYVEAVDQTGVVYRSRDFRIPVTTACECALTPVQNQYAQNLVLGETAEVQVNERPFGFQCEGIVSRIGPDRELREDRACRDDLLLAAAPAAGAAGAGWLIPAAVLAGVAATAIIIDNNEDVQVSPVQ